MTIVSGSKRPAAHEVLRGSYRGDRGFELATISGYAPQESKPLAEQVDQTVKMLRNPPGETSPGRVGGVTVDREAMALDLETGLGAVDSVRADYLVKKKEADGTRQAVNAAIAGFDAVFPGVQRPCRPQADGRDRCNDLLVGN